MNAIRQTQQLNKRELENATPPSASWHADYRDTAWLYVGGLPLDLSEGDVVTIFSQFGNPTHLNLIRDRETGNSKGFGFLKYEDQRSCDLAVDNLTGADVLGRLLRVDHTRYKKKDDEDEDTHRIDRREADAQAEQNGKRASDTDESEEERRRRKKRRPMLKQEKELEELLAIKENGEDEDPMKDYLVREKRDEVERARKREDNREKRQGHHHRRYKDDHGDRDSRTGKHRELGDEGDSHNHPRHRRRDAHKGADRPQTSQRRERRQDEESDDGSRDPKRNGKDRRTRRHNNGSSESDGGAPLRRSGSKTREHGSPRRRHSPGDEYDRPDSGKQRRRRHKDD